MGFYIKRSFSLGPFRINLSKSGVGVSVGMRGFRVGTGPRGSYVHMGRDGIYYRKSLPGFLEVLGLKQPESETEDGEASLPEANVPEGMMVYESTDVQFMQDSSSADLLGELQEQNSKMTRWPYVAGFSLIAVIAASILLFPIAIIVCPAGLLLTAAVTFLAYQRDQVEKSVVLFYDLDEAAEAAFEKLYQGFGVLSSSNQIWHVHAVGDVVAEEGEKQQPVASAELLRTPIRPAMKSPPFVETNIAVPALPVGRQTLYFFPDRALIYDGKYVGAIRYPDLTVKEWPFTVLEDGPIAPDAEVVGEQYKALNKDGTPDQRFADNVKLPEVKYTKVHLTSNAGLNELIVASKQGVAEGISNAISELSSITVEAEIKKK